MQDANGNVLCTLSCSALLESNDEVIRIGIALRRRIACLFLLLLDIGAIPFAVRFKVIADTMEYAVAGALAAAIALVLLPTIVLVEEAVLHKKSGNITVRRRWPLLRPKNVELSEPQFLVLHRVLLPRLWAWHCLCVRCSDGELRLFLSKHEGDKLGLLFLDALPGVTLLTGSARHTMKYAAKDLTHPRRNDLPYWSILLSIGGLATVIYAEVMGVAALRYVGWSLCLVGLVAGQIVRMVQTWRSMKPGDAYDRFCALVDSNRIRTIASHSDFVWGAFMMLLMGITLLCVGSIVFGTLLLTGAVLALLIPFIVPQVYRGIWYVPDAESNLAASRSTRNWRMPSLLLGPLMIGMVGGASVAEGLVRGNEFATGLGWILMGFAGVAFVYTLVSERFKTRK